MKVTIAQLNPTVGDIEGNLKKMTYALEKASQDSSDLVVLPELFLTGYPPRDLLEKEWFIEKNQQAVQMMVNISKQYSQTGILFGDPVLNNLNGKGLYNSAILVYRGRIWGRQHKSLLPTYDVFDEARYFEPATEIHTVIFKGENLGISICEDAWNDSTLWLKRRIYSSDPIDILAKKGSSLFINISASPYQMGKEAVRYRLISNYAARHGIPFLYVNQVGANDELIFDGQSMLFDREGRPVVICPAFKEHLESIDVSLPGSNRSYLFPDEIESVYAALVMGIKDYMAKCGFNKAVLGLSGGIDSAVTACLASEAIGAQNVLGISMPAAHSSPGSIGDARKLVQNLGIEFRVIPISEIYSSYLKTIEPYLVDNSPGITEENIQARIRGNILMAFSNKYDYLVLSTGNKSELAVGYCTLYGDMSGGLSVLADVPKTMVYKLAHYINRKSEVIPREIISKPPSAELRPGQLDQDELPPYEILDQILHYYIEEGFSLSELIKYGFDPKILQWIINAVDKNEYKRRQAPPGLKVTSKAFGTGRRLPVAACIRHF